MNTAMSLFGSRPAVAPIPDTASTPGPSASGTAAVTTVCSNTSSPASTPSATSSQSMNTYVMPTSPTHRTSFISKGRDLAHRPRVNRTLGQRPSCLINASLTYCGGNKIYAFGGFDHVTDEVYNQVRRLDLTSYQWTLVDNYGDIPGVRMGHTATLYQGDKLIVYGGEDEHREHLSDLIIFDTKTAHWTQPAISGPIPKGRARHAAVLHDDKLFVVGGISGINNTVLDDICFLDLNTFTWSQSWRFVPRFDHAAFVYNDRVWVYGGLGKDAVKCSDLAWLELKELHVSDPTTVATRSARFDGSPGRFENGRYVPPRAHAMPSPNRQLPNTGIVHTSFATAYVPMAPTVGTSMQFWGPNVPTANRGSHFSIHLSGSLIDFMAPSPSTPPRECGIYSLSLETKNWQQLAPGIDVFKSGHRWQYCAMNDEGTMAWLVGSQESLAPDLGTQQESLGDVLEIDLTAFGMLGVGHATTTTQRRSRGMYGLRTPAQPSRGLAADFSLLFDRTDISTGADIAITGLAFERNPADPHAMLLITSDHCSPVSPAIHVHLFVLLARWPHFVRVWESQMREFHTRKMHIDEPYPVVRALLHYLYTDNIHGPAPLDSSGTALVVPGTLTSTSHTPLSVVALLLVLSDMYDMSHLRSLCVQRLARELDVEHAPLIWYYARRAKEHWLRRRAATFILQNWGKTVRTCTYAALPHEALVALSQAIGTRGRVLDDDNPDDDDEEEYPFGDSRC